MINVKGFTLIEIVIVCAIIVLLAVVVSGLGRDIFLNNYFLQKSLVAEGDAKGAINKIVKELRGAAPAETGAYPVELASTTAIIFYSDVDSDSQTERIHYFLDGRALKRGLVEPVGQPMVYNTSNETVSILANDMVNQLVFSYFNSSYDGTASSSSLVQPVAVQEPRLVKIELLIDANPDRSPKPLYLTSQVMLRNLKDNW